VFIELAARSCCIFDSTSVVMAAVDQQRHRVEYATAANASALVRQNSVADRIRPVKG